MFSILRSILPYALPLLLAAAALIRVVVYFAFPSVFAWDATGAIHGSASYDQYAVNLLETGVYGLSPGIPDAVIPPLYSTVVAGLYALFGRGSLTIALAHTAFDLVAVALLVDTARRLFRPYGQWIGLVAGALYALYPYLIFQNLTLIDTPLFMLLLHLFTWLVVRLRERDHTDAAAWALAVTAGFVLGAAALVRPVVAFFALVLPLWFLMRRPLAVALVRLIPVAAASLVVLLPWMVRNHAVYGQFVAMSITAGSNFYQGNNPDVIPLMRAGYDVQWTAPDPALIDAPPGSPEADRQRQQIALDWLRANPHIVPELLWVKFVTHWSIDVFPWQNPTEGADPNPDVPGDAAITLEGAPGAAPAVNITGLPQGDPVTAYAGGAFALGRIVHRFYFGGLLILALIGLTITRRGWRDVSLIWLMQIAMTLAYVIFHSSTRYRVPTDPFLFTFSAAAWVYGAAALRTWASARRSPRMNPPAPA
ncbi:MAG: glycosyltransferase family 39 protein [bacterium]|nr:glycosyltransferase family 39 protein [bacterium]